MTTAYFNNQQWAHNPPSSVPLNRGHWSTRGLVGVWDRREGSGTTLLDRSGFGNNGTISGATDVVTSSGNALSFDGVDDYVNLGSGSLISSLSELSVVARIHPDSVGELGGRILDNGQWLFLHIDSAGSQGLRFVTSNTGNALIRTSEDFIVYGESQDVVLTWDGSLNQTGVKIYRNGFESASYNTFLNDQDGTGTRSGEGDLYLGNSAATDRTHDGEIEFVYLYNRVLSADEVLSLYVDPFQIYRPQLNFVPEITGPSVLSVTDSGYNELGAGDLDGASDAIMITENDGSGDTNKRYCYLTLSNIGASLDYAKVELNLRVKGETNSVGPTAHIRYAGCTQLAYDIDDHAVQTEFTGTAPNTILTMPTSAGTVEDRTVNLTAFLKEAIADTTNLDSGGGYNSSKDLTLVFLMNGLPTTPNQCFLYDNSGSDDATAKNYTLTLTESLGGTYYYQMMLAGAA